MSIFSFCCHICPYLLPHLSLQAAVCASVCCCSCICVMTYLSLYAHSFFFCLLSYFSLFLAAFASVCYRFCSGLPPYLIYVSVYCRIRHSLLPVLPLFATEYFTSHFFLCLLSYLSLFAAAFVIAGCLMWISVQL